MYSADYKNRYLELIYQFLSSEIDGAKFQEAYMKLWKYDRGETYAIK